MKNNSILYLLILKIVLSSVNLPIFRESEMQLSYCLIPLWELFWSLAQPRVRLYAKNVLRQRRNHLVQLNKIPIYARSKQTSKLTWFGNRHKQLNNLMHWYWPFACHYLFVSWCVPTKHFSVIYLLSYLLTLMHNALASNHHFFGPSWAIHHCEISLIRNFKSSHAWFWVDCV